ncbi:hypothetical protein GBAR_LOCUS13916 [Geodia barretti]|uniref:Uncharacterized protein n=1 Tax=Geodia barretti TaxID=519541 RepID=A0AA35WRD9_GEOBA|nr:hypothetical protein GBAR_LOCUS13916 [Geodia barretti]
MNHGIPAVSNQPQRGYPSHHVSRTSTTHGYRPLDIMPPTWTDLWWGSEMFSSPYHHC